MQEALKGVHKLVLAAAAGSCTCHTKSPELVYHDAGCRFLLLSEALDGIESLRRPSSDLAEALRELLDATAQAVTPTSGDQMRFYAAQSRARAALSAHADSMPCSEDGRPDTQTSGPGNSRTP